MKPLKIFIATGTKAAIEITEAQYAIRTLADIAGLPIHFFSNSKKGPFDLAYASDPSQLDCRIFIPISHTGSRSTVRQVAHLPPHWPRTR